MAFLDHEGAADFPYSKEDVLEAMARAIPGLPGLEIESIDKLSGRVIAKAGMSLMSWGETIPISVTELSPGRTRVSIISAPKTGLLFGGALDGGKNRRNVEAILSAVSAELSLKPPVEPPPPLAGSDPAPRLAKLKTLFEEGLITEADYNARKSEILSEL
jgi:Short C-terminal domain